MAKTVAPMLSFEGSGQVAKTMVYGSWRGVKYVRRYVTPANPNSANQRQTRSVFSWLSSVWKLLDPAAQAVWTAFAKGQPLTDRNAWNKFNIPAINGDAGAPDAVITTLIGSPGVNGGLAPAAVVLSDGGGHSAVATMTAPTLPAGWSITAAHAFAIKQQDPHSGTFFTSYYGMDAAAPYAPSMALGAAMTAVVTSWFEFMKPDGSTAYGPSSTAAIVVA